MKIDYASKIRSLRCKLNLSQFEIELMAGFSPGTISRIENGKVNPSKETLFIIACILELSFADTVELFGIKEVMSSLKHFQSPREKAA